MILDRVLDNSSARPGYQITVRIRVVDLKSEVERLESVVGSTTDIRMCQLESLLAVAHGKLVHLVDDRLERLLQVRRIVDLEHHLPRRSRQQRAVYCECELTAEWFCEVLSNVQPRLT